ncbi:MAG: NAD(+) diphosphatase [Spirochaetia bacterium]|jgi:NAD+ diphosphatase|nr:NAD(+) diphosphatase [Spirochaetia bacterium]
MKSSRYAFRGSEILVRARPDPESLFDPSLLDCSEVSLPEPGDRLSFLSIGCACELHAHDVDVPSGWEWKPFRSIIGEATEEAWTLAARSMAYLNWHASTKYCGRCGALNADKPDEIARLCPACGALSFPRLSPAILAVVRKDDRLLLGRNAANTTGMWSVLAGFVEPGETFEACVRRELMEEVSVEVAVQGYLGSQPWPFPDQLMIGFKAAWLSGELRPDGVEIAEAGWFGADDHPPLPRHGSLSRRLIDAAFAEIKREDTRR